MSRQIKKLLSVGDVVYSAQAELIESLPDKLIIKKREDD